MRRLAKRARAYSREPSISKRRPCQLTERKPIVALRRVRATIATTILAGGERQLRSAAAD